MVNEQVQQVLDIVNSVVGEQVRGAYLFGSAVVGGLKPRSDLDLMVVCARRITEDERGALIRKLLDVSAKPRYVEVTIVVEGEIKPWRYPPRMDFQYGDWWRPEFESGDLQPWEEMNPDLATLVKMVLIADNPLQGPPPAEIFDPVPQQDLVAATFAGIEPLLQDLEGDARNVVLTLARMWSSLTTGQITSKDAAASWALARLPERHQEVVAEARAVYLGDEQHESEDFVARARQFADHVLAQIQKDSRPQHS
ncbi:MAG TPA: aminoglycoside adenylyltransferase family protein [Actinomycetota bacterium]|nr:aminoglycoside adenylyltransferase family protein [Actinomycetota bacterium]